MSRQHDCSILQQQSARRYVNTLLLVLIGQNYQREENRADTFGIYQFPCLITLFKRLQQCAVTRPVESTAVLARSEVCYASSGQRIC